MKLHKTKYVQINSLGSITFKLNNTDRILFTFLVKDSNNFFLNKKQKTINNKINLQQFFYKNKYVINK